MTVKRQLGLVEEFLKSYQMTLWLAFITSMTTVVWMEERVDNHEARLQKIESSVPDMQLKIHDLERDSQLPPKERRDFVVIPRSPAERRSLRLHNGDENEE